VSGLRRDVVASATQAGVRQPKSKIPALESFEMSQHALTSTINCPDDVAERLKSEKHHVGALGHHPKENHGMKIGVDMGGTKIEIIALDDAGRILYRQRIRTPARYSDTLDCLTNLVDGAEASLGRKGTVGLGMKGSIDAEGRAKVSADCINGRPFITDVENRLSRKIRFANDANCFALSEAIDGAGAECGVVFGVILGTGCGGGLAVNGKILPGANSIAGEWGHNRMPFATAQELEELRNCIQCGVPGCIETYLCGTAFKDLFGPFAGGPSSGPDTENSPAASGPQDEYCDRLARGLSTVINIVDPEVIVLGGGISNNRFIYEKTPQLLKNYVVGGECTTPVCQALHGDSSGVRGAAWLW